MKTFDKRAIRKFTITMLIVVTTYILTGISYSQPNEDWISIYNNYDKDDKAQAMAMDKRGYIYVTGYSEGKGTGKDFLTIKYSPAGNEIWSARYEGVGSSGESVDVANAIAVDEQDNVYVTGYSTLGRAGLDYCTIKYNEKGEEQWVNYFSGLGHLAYSHDEATSIAIDKTGGVYVVGNSNRAGNGYDICLVKYDKSGEEIWASLLNGDANNDDRAVSVKTDKSGFVFVAGITEGLSSNKDYYLAKFSESGKKIWEAKYNGIGGNARINDDELSALEVDAAGNSYVTGYSYGAGTAKDFSTVKYDSDGQQLWVLRTDNSQLPKNIVTDDEAKAIAVSSSGEVYVTGRTISFRGSDFLTVKIGAKGEKLWSKTYNNQKFGAGEEQAEAIALDKRGNIFVTGYTNSEAFFGDCGTGKDFCTVKYSSSGDVQWVKEFNGSGGIGRNDDEAKAIIVDSRGRIFVMGQSMGEETELDYCLIRYSEYFPLPEETGVNKDGRFELKDNFPDPFNPTTKISFNIPFSSNVKLAVYDISGKEVEALENKFLQAGNYQYEWNASQFASGTYFYKIQADGFVQTKKMLLIK